MSEPLKPTDYVMIIEDDADIREIVQLTLTLQTISSSAVRNGAEALEFLRGSERLPSLILLDLRMPVMNGETFRQHQLDDPRLRAIPTVLISADAHLDELASRMAISSVLNKPFSHKDLIRILEIHKLV